MKMARPRASRTSRCTTHMRSAFLALIVMTAGCAPLAPCPKCPPAKPAPETAVYLQFTFDGLPGWPSADLDRSLRTFLAGCPRSGPFSQVCARAASVPPDDPVAARAFFEANFVPYALVSSDEIGRAHVCTPVTATSRI